MVARIRLVASPAVDLGLRGKVAAIAASSRGLGRAAADALAREGCDVAICGRDSGTVREAETALTAAGARVHAVTLDLSEPGACERFIDGTVAALGRIDVLVTNNGGPPSGPIAAADEAAYRDAVEALLFVAVRLTRAALPHMRAQRWGRVLHMTSSATRQLMDGLGVSATARAGVVAFAKALANEVAREGITVNCVAPGPFLTDRILSLAAERAAREGITPDEALAQQERAIPAGRMGRVEEFGALCAFLASEQAGYITGAIYQIDGGSVRAMF